MPRGGRESGQAAVETAIVMPFFVFLVLGMLQLGLAHQARLMARYAAYKGTRAGALQRASQGAMEQAALAAWLPMVGRKASPSFYKVGDPGSYNSSWGMASGNDQEGLPSVKVTVCGPLKSQMSETDDFDDPRVGSGKEDWKGFTRSRLHAQFTFNYRLVIPFANGVLFYAALGGGGKDDLMALLRMKRATGEDEAKGNTTLSKLSGKADEGKYFLPIRANYAMRMQSNVGRNALPATNKCKIGWDKQSGEAAHQRKLDTTKLE